MPGRTGDATARGTARAAGTARTPKGDLRRGQLARAAAELVRAEGPVALSHRAVAARAGLPLAATTYYYRGLDDLAAAAGSALVADWVAHADGVLRRVRSAPAPDPVAAVVEAVLPPGDDATVRAHYEQLLAAARVPALAAALGAGRARLDAVLEQLLDALGRGDVAPATVLALVDGAVVAAASEGRPVRETARALLADALPGRAPLPRAAGADAVR
ncbi:TetR/AcrR family transcriptional regulator [Cellulomonas sp. C5510]|uniref:TetR/AcrR family transcriptional regulator n=1 Tax=Cellulomonas sp. C5510 TaxID=2871170 RepID=UPI001C957607|nr:hypothetical protein [Cellulomonas sp. C5510]QZN85983.1 hypothetical protein K5O09_01855 [Cellulomonas sp. C5510]